MAKKTDPITEDIPSGDKTTYEDIHNQTEEQIIENKPNVEKETSKTTDNVIEDKKTSENPKEPPIDPEKLAEQVSQRAADKIIERMTGVKDKKNETDDELIAPWKKEGRSPRDYEEIADWALQKKEILDTRSKKEAELRSIEDKKQQEKSQQERAKAFNDQVDAHLDDLYASGKLPPIANKEDPNDRGVIARKALFQTLLEAVKVVEQTNLTRLAEGKNPIPYPTLKEVFYEKYKAPGQQPAGVNAPVSFGQGAPSTTNDKNDGYVWSRDHNRSWEDIIRG